MTTEHTANGLIGAPIRRVEDPLLLVGKGCFVDDINLPGMLHMVVLRSPYAHAKIRSIDTQAAKAIKGVVTVVTGAELPERLNINARSRRRSRPGHTGRRGDRGKPRHRPGRLQRDRRGIRTVACGTKR
jgi:CO/xanthine dehydrogenase Mo-binding subunit